MATNNDDIQFMPLTYELPDGDIVQLCTWAFVLEKLKTLFVPMTDAITAENEDLDAINNRILEWIAEQQSDET